MKKHTDVPSPSEEAELLKDLESQGQTHVFEALTDPSLSPENKNHILSTLKHFNIKRLPILLEAYASKSNLGEAERLHPAETRRCQAEVFLRGT